MCTAVNATERNFRQSRRDFKALPFATDACGDLAAQVEAERRCDTVVDAPFTQMETDGRLTSELGSLPISERALEGLSRLVTPGGLQLASTGLTSSSSTITSVPIT